MRQLKITKQITNRETESLNKYLQEVSNLEMITADEEVELAQRIKKGDEKALHKLVTANLRFVVSVAKQYQNRGLRLTDLINEGNIGLVKAARRFDETRGFKFISYAVWWIRQSILKAIGEHSRTVRLPVNKNAAINKVLSARSLLEQEFEREPSPEELAQATDLSKNEIKGAIKHARRAISIDAPLSSDNDDFNLQSVLNTDDSPKPDANLIKDSLQTEISRSLNLLTSRQSAVLQLNFGLDGYRAMSLSEIGDLFNLSRERVRQIRDKALNKLRIKALHQNLIPFLG
ncbi:sigma-70 family RNA polymerase sigma factor [Winogradskyella tangerina]|uniref:sigma-70 family RNA polymerase sigma factor n=1 Tax=Winogradskyella tangerina TaxID=2023240 RepID=UPI000DBE7C8D|nr:RNA polymerase sigma factor RpoD/SigA [Winogradskyella tangerina]